ncbi:MAG: ABC transporter substrate-binding protein [Chloroflexota bacterium]
MTIKIGLLATLIGPYQKPGEDGVRGAKLALDEFNFTVGGDTVELVV